MKEQLEQIKQSALVALDEASSTAVLEELRIKLLGKKGELTAVLKLMGKLSAEERPIGGLGIFLIRQIMNEVKYERIDGKNVLTLEKKL